MNNKTLNSIKCLAIDMIKNANNGHTGIVLSAAPIVYALYKDHLNALGSNPLWANRDRFVVSCGHASALIYAMLYYAGYDYSLEDLKRFNDIDSFTPGHPIYNPSLGIETTSGALGEGISQAVGIALGEKYLEHLCKGYDKNSKIVDFYTYVLASDGDLQEGVAQESMAFAGKQKLSKLIILYDRNNMTLDGSLDNTSDEYIFDKYESIGFSVFKTSDSVASISSAIGNAKKSNKPSLVIVNTHIGKDTAYVDNNIIHSKVLSDEEIIELKNKYHLSYNVFDVDENQKENLINSLYNRVGKKMNKWNKQANEIRKNDDKKLVKVLDLLEKGDISINFDPDNYQINDKYNEDMRLSNNKVINFIASKTPFMLALSADLFESTKAKIENGFILNDDNPTGKNIEMGVREHAMGGVINGLGLLNLKAFGSTYLSFSDYLLPAMRIAAIQNTSSTFVFTHDGVSNGFDGPTHQAVEQLTTLRAMPNMVTFRPCDIKEVMGCWQYILKNNRPVSLIISKEKEKIQVHTNANYVKYGAYIVRKEKEFLDGIIVATGSEVSVALEIANKLYEQNLDIRVVSMPSMELFLEQNPVYEEKLLPKDVKTITLEAGSPLIWHRFATNKDFALGINNFGSSGKTEDVLKFAGFDFDTLYPKIKKMFESE